MAERFGRSFLDDPTIYIPKVFIDTTSKKVLTMELVEGIKVSEIDTLEDTGYDRDVITVRGTDFILKQVFDHGFFHADPHPGNLFVEPGKEDENDENNWQLTFVDFGMVGRVPKNLDTGLRELIIALATKDAKRMINSYLMLDMLLPGADLELIAKADAKVFDRFWGMTME